jgi:hypothetical protein
VHLVFGLFLRGAEVVDLIPKVTDLGGGSFSGSIHVGRAVRANLRYKYLARPARTACDIVELPHDGSPSCMRVSHGL